jgi:hypothetical protein
MMTFKRFLAILLIAALLFIAGVAVGRFVLAPRVEIVVVDVEKLAELIEKYNVLADEIREEFAAIKEWNKENITEPQPEEEGEKR